VGRRRSRVGLEQGGDSLERCWTLERGEDWLEGRYTLDRGGDWLEGALDPRASWRLGAWARALDGWARSVAGP
jgi:hypothetical protein